MVTELTIEAFGAINMPEFNLGVAEFKLITFQCIDESSFFMLF
jgi:hypothetical protein